MPTVHQGRALNHASAGSSDGLMMLIMLLGGRPQKGIITYTLSANRQRPLAGTMQAAVFNTYRRARSQFLYVVPPFIIAYVAMNWAIEKYV